MSPFTTKSNTVILAEARTHTLHQKLRKTRRRKVSMGPGVRQDDDVESIGSTN